MCGVVVGCGCDVVWDGVGIVWLMGDVVWSDWVCCLEMIGLILVKLWVCLLLVKLFVLVVVYFCVVCKCGVYVVRYGGCVWNELLW